MKRKIISLCAVAICATAIIGCLMYKQCKSRLAEYNLAMEGYIADNGYGYVVDNSGELLKLDLENPGEGRVYLISDDTQYIYINADEKLILGDVKSGEENIVCNNVSDINMVSNKYICYYKDYDWEALFIPSENKERRINPLVTTYEISEHETSFCYLKNEKINVLSESGEEKFSENVTEESEIHFVSDDGKFVVWSNYDENKNRIHMYCWNNGESNEVFTYRGDGVWNDRDMPLVISGADKSFIIINNIIDDESYIVRSNGDIHQLDFVVYEAFSKNGPIENDAKVKEMYLMTYVMDNTSFVEWEASLYYVTLNGEVTKITDDISDIAFGDGKAYVVKDDELKVVKFDGPRAKIKEEVDDDVYWISPLVEDGQIYYLKDGRNDYRAGTLCGYTHTNGVKEIDEDVCVFYFTRNSVVESQDGKTIYYSKYDNTKSLLELYGCKKGKDPKHITDYYSSSVNSKLTERNKVPNGFFVTVGEYDNGIPTKLVYCKDGEVKEKFDTY